jgi:lipopolysaccharide biosynthesis glycosyltransferase
MEIELCMASDDNYCPHMGINIISIVENNSTFENINIHILNNNISQNNLNKLKQIQKENNNLHLYFYDINHYFNQNQYSKIISTELKNNSFFNLLGITAYSRLFLGDILPKNIDKILYLDADTIVLNDLKELFDTDLEGYYCGGVINMNGNSTKSFYTGKQYDTPFVNSGVLLINVKKWRTSNFIESFIELIKTYPDKNYLHDQNIINILSEGKILLLDPKYNVMSEFYYVNYRKYLKLNSYFESIDKFYSEDQMQNALDNPTIVHFLSQMWHRPWIKQNGLIKHKIKNPFNEKYIYYKSISPWSDEPLQESNQSLTRKIYYEIIRIIMIYFPAYFILLLQKLKNR